MRCFAWRAGFFPFQFASQEPSKSLKLIDQMIQVSVETVRIVKNLPALMSSTERI